MIQFDDILAAERAIQGEILRTPTIASPSLSARTGADVWLKLENLQHAGSFKARGALVKLLGLDADQRGRGVIAMSAGNHAQGVAWHARRLGIPATIVMPEATPFNKIEKTTALGARVVLRGETLTESEQAARAMGETEGLALVHPYDDPAIIAGQGTVALEMLTDAPDLDVLVVPVGGAGLISGIAIAAKARHPSIEIVGVQAALYPAMVQALKGEPIACSGQTIAEGIAVKRPGELTRPIIAALVSDMLTVSEDGLERAVQLMFDSQKVVAEGAGAAPLAALLENRDRFAGRRVGLVLSGGNIDSRLLASILLRGLARDGRIARLRIEISDIPGALAKVARLIGEGAGNIIEIYHQRLFHDVPVKMAELDVVIETTSGAHVLAIADTLRTAGFPTRVLAGVAREDRG